MGWYSIFVDNFINRWYQGIPPSRYTRLWQDSVWHRCAFCFCIQRMRVWNSLTGYLSRSGFCRKATTPLEANLSEAASRTSPGLGTPAASLQLFRYLWLIFVGDICVKAYSIKEHFLAAVCFCAELHVCNAPPCGRQRTGLLFLLHSIVHPWLSADTLECWQFHNFMWMIPVTLFNVYFLEPQATKVSHRSLQIRFSSMVCLYYYVGSFHIEQWKRWLSRMTSAPCFIFFL